MKTLLFIILILLFAAGCNKSLDVANVPFYPVGAGSIWTYAGMDTIFNFRAAASGISFRDTAVHWTTRIDSLSDVILHDSVHTSAFRSTDTYNGSQQFVSHYYYINENDSLFLYAYDGGSGALPKKLSRYEIVFGGITFRSLTDIHRFVQEQRLVSLSPVPETIVYEQYPPKVMVFPLRVGSLWTFRERGYPFFIGKKVVGTESISTPAGGYAAYKIEWSWDFDNDSVVDTNIQAFDYVTNNGLMKRTLLLKNAVVTSGGDPTPLGYVDIREEYAVTSFTIHEANVNKRIPL